MHITRCYLDGQYFQLEVNVDRAALERAVLAATGRAPPSSGSRPQIVGRSPL